MDSLKYSKEIGEVVAEYSKEDFIKDSEVIAKALGGLFFYAPVQEGSYKKSGDNYPQNI